MAVSAPTKRRYKNPRTRAKEARVLDVEIVKEEFPPPTSPKVQISPQRGGVAIWSNALFYNPPLSIFGNSCPGSSACQVKHTPRGSDINKTKIVYKL